MPATPSTAATSRSVFRLTMAALILLGSNITLAAASNGEFHAAMGEAMSRMHHDMSSEASGDVDRDFAAMMIPHHQGAVDMAVLELRHGKDQRLRRLAHGIIVEQEQEIRLMRKVLADLSNGPPRPPAGHSRYEGEHR